MPAVTYLGLIETILRHIEAKDLSASMAYFTENAEFHDPHYPQAHMCGQTAIKAGLQWGFASLKSFSFTILDVYTSGAGNRVAVEIRAAHVLPNGQPLNFTEVFLFEFAGDKIQSLRVFVPYGPHGIIGIVLFVQRVIYKLKHGF